MATTTTFSELDAAATLDGTEIVPIDQDSTTVRTTTSDIAALASSTSLVYSIKSANFTAAAGGRYGLVTSTAAITVTLPAVDVTGGQAIEISDIALSANTNHITLDADGSDQIVLGSTTAGTATISTPGAIVRLIPRSTGLWRAMLVASA